MKRLLLPVLLIAGVSGIGQKQVIDFPQKYSASITPAGLKEKLSVIASAEMQGRETATAGQRKAASYIESFFQKMGLVQGTTGGYQMQFPVYQDTLIEASFYVAGKQYKLDQSWDINVSSAANGTFDIKEIVYASYGHVDSSRNDYKDLNIKGKWVLIYEAAAPGSSIADKRGYLKSKVEKANELGAKGIFILSPDFPRKDASETKGRMFLKKAATSNFPVIYVNNELAHKLLGMNPEQLLQSLKNIPTGSYNSTTQYTINKRTLMLQSSNVLGIIPGTDKKDEYVVITAHYDHLGVRGDNIYYGADDDGSGTTAVMQLAEAFARARNEGHGPRRSIVFMTVSGEEKGLLGSQFYTDHPAYPLDKTLVNLNVDMVGRIDPTYVGDSLNYLYVVGDDKLSSDLTRITDSG